MSNLKQAIKQNYLKCAKDPSYFINEFCVIQHPQRGKIKFKLYPFQEDCLRLSSPTENSTMQRQQKRMRLTRISLFYAHYITRTVTLIK